MENNKKRRTATVAAIVLAAALVFGGGTLAYLTATSGEVQNTFNTNNNGVELNETPNTYDIIPGTSQSKDPTVTATYTLDSYVYVEVEDATYDLVTWYIANGWTELSSSTDAGVTTTVYYMELEKADTAGWSTVSSGDYEGQLTSTDNNGVTYYYDSSDGEYTAVIPVLSGNTVSYSSDITNQDMKDATDAADAAGSSIELNFVAYIMQMQSGEYNLTPANAFAIATGKSNAVAMVGSTMYESMYEAFKALNSGDTLILLQDSSLDSSVGGSYLTGNDPGVLADNYTVDLNGYTLTVSKALNLTAEVALGPEDTYNDLVNSVIDSWGYTQDQAEAYVLNALGASSKAEALTLLASSYNPGYDITPTTVVVKNGTINASSNGRIYLSEYTNATFEDVTFTTSNSTLTTAVDYYTYFEAGDNNALTFAGCTFSGTKVNLEVNSSHVTSTTIATTFDSSCTYISPTTADNVLSVGAGVSTDTE